MILPAMMLLVGNGKVSFAMGDGFDSPHAIGTVPNILVIQVPIVSIATENALLVLGVNNIPILGIPGHLVEEPLGVVAALGVLMINMIVVIISR